MEKSAIWIIIFGFFFPVLQGQQASDPSGLIKTVIPLEDGSYEIKEFTSDSVLLYKGKLSSIDPDVRNGRFYFYSDSGSIWAVGQYLNDIPYGEWIQYGPSGDTASLVDYSALMNFLMEEDSTEFGIEILYLCEIMPKFNGGDPAIEFRKYLSENMVYPPYAATKGYGGRLIVQFMVDTTGRVRNPQIVRLGFTDLNMEALRVISESPGWEPGLQRGKPVDILFTFPLSFETFNLPARTPEPEKAKKKKGKKRIRQ